MRSGTAEDEVDDEEELRPKPEEQPRNISECMSMMHQVKYFLCCQPDMDDETYAHVAGVLQYLTSKQQDKLSQRKIIDFFRR